MVIKRDIRVEQRGPLVKGVDVWRGRTSQREGRGAYAACSKVRSGACIVFVVAPRLGPVQSVLMVGIMDVEYGDAGGRGHVCEEMHSLEDGKKQRNGEDKGSSLYERPRHGKIIISAPISSWDCEGEIPSEGMKGASRQTRWTYLEVHRDFPFRSAEPPDRASPVVSESDSWHEPVTIELSGFKSST